MRATLRHYRERQGLSQERLAHEVGVSTSTVANWEHGSYAPQVKHRPRLAEVLGVSLTELALLLDGKDPGEASSLNGSVPDWLSLFARAEQSSEAAWVFEIAAMPALLQTRDYATSIEQLGHLSFSDAEVARRVEMRMARQRVLDRDPPLRLTAIIDETVLCRAVGGRSVMGAQLDHLLEMAERPSIEIRIISGPHAVAASFGAFSLLTTSGSAGPDLACNDGLTSMHYLEGPTDVAQHASLFQHLLAVAAPPAASTRLITTTRESYR